MKKEKEKEEMKIPGMINDGEEHYPIKSNDSDLAIKTRLITGLVWEYTKAIVTICIVLANLIVAIKQGFTGLDQHHPHILSNTLFLVMGFYLSQTKFNVRK